MAILDNLFDSGSGRLGNLVVYKLNGRGIVRTKPERYRDLKSPAQLAQRQRLQAMNDFLKPFSKLLKITFPVETPGRSARAEAQSYLMRNALEGEYPDIYVDKSRALLSRGPLPLPVKATVTTHAGELLIEWENDADTAKRHPNDTLLVMALLAESGYADYSFSNTRRTEGRYAWKPALPEGKYDVWIAFRNQEQTKMSDSMFAGVEEV